MRPPTTSDRVRIPAAFGLMLLLSLTACSVKQPTGPRIDPLVGTWTGALTDPFNGVSMPETFTLTVQAGGVVTATGYMWYNISDLPVYLHLSFRGEIDPDGVITGQGEYIRQRWTWASPTSILITTYAGPARAHGLLSAFTGDGEGYLQPGGAGSRRYSWDAARVTR